jgi:uncharacterized protein YceK
MKKRNIVMLFLIMLFLSGCGPIYQTTYSYQPPKSQMGIMCVSQCVQTKAMCQQLCQIQDQNCRNQEHQYAFYRYEAYRDKQTAQDKKIDKTVDDFDQGFLQCKTMCHCEVDFNLCYQNCGGVVLQHQVCTAFCD